MKVGSAVCRAGRYAFGVVLFAIGAALAVGGARLIYLGGSFYYLPAGLAAACSGVAVLRGRWRVGSAIYLVLFAVSLVWGLLEAGLDGWALAPRILSPFVLGLPFVFIAIIRGERTERIGWLAISAAVIILAVSVWLTSGFHPAQAAKRKASPAVALPTGEWPHVGNTQAGTQFSPLSQINRENVRKLKIAWSVLLGPLPITPLASMEAVPIKIGGHIYVCTPTSDVVDIEPETGNVRWRYDAEADLTGLDSTRCRGVAYYVVPDASGQCSRRVYVASTDARLIALDALNGKPCSSFGDGGMVDLKKGISQRSPGYYRISSAPTIVRGKLVIGAAVADGQYVGEPSGVVRAFDAVTGEMAWAWDPGNPGHHGEPQAGEGFVPGTPNVWAPMSADETLGLIYAPTGNATPDYWGGHRSEESNRFASSVVALDAATGEPRWSFQTTHYDVWDYDVASQPVLVDLRTPEGIVPAVVQPTKRGQIFVLDRRTGKPIFPVVERPAPQAGAVEKLSAVQPWSPALPDLGGPRLTERSMWGMTALDQLWCRIKFREARYEGSLTPPGLTYSIAAPGYIGGVNWGSAAIDTDRQLAFMLSSRLVNRVRLLPRSNPIARDLKPDPASNIGRLGAQTGTPYAADINSFFSPIGMPCQAPPHGLINAIDLKTGKLVWSRPLGSARDMGPMGIPSRLPFTIGTPLFGGAMATAGGLVFAGGSMDHAFRAFDSETGKQLFEADLPGMSMSRPVTFLTGRNDRQLVVVASEAPRKNGKAYGAITAFALPKD